MNKLLSAVAFVGASLLALPAMAQWAQGHVGLTDASGPCYYFQFTETGNAWYVIPYTTSNGTVIPIARDEVGDIQLARIQGSLVRLYNGNIPLSQCDNSSRWADGISIQATGQ